MRWFTTSVLTLFLTATQTGFAATLIETKNGDGATQQIWLEGQQMRVKSSHEAGYMIFNANGPQMYVVDPEHHQAVDMSGMFSHQNGAPDVENKVKVDLVRQGDGPKIAGYDTEHYVLQADGQKCSDEYLSKRALHDVGSLEVFEAMARMAPSAHAGMQGQVDPCQSAQTTLRAGYEAHGYPMRIVSPEGMLEHEVTHIQTNATLPEGGFAPPAGYEVIPFEKMMQQAPPGAHHGMQNPGEKEH